MSYEPSDSEVSAFIRSHPSGGTLDEIAQILGVTKQRADQIERRALDKLEKELRWRRIGGMDGVM